MTMADFVRPLFLIVYCIANESDKLWDLSIPSKFYFLNSSAV